MKISDFDKLIKEAVSEKMKSDIKKDVIEKYMVKTEDGLPLESFDNAEQAENYIESEKEKNPKQKLLIDKKTYKSYDEMLEDLDEINDKLEESNDKNSDMKNKKIPTQDFMKNESVIMLAKAASKFSDKSSSKLKSLVESSSDGKTPLKDVINVLNEFKLDNLKNLIVLKEQEDMSHSSDDEFFDFEKHGGAEFDDEEDDDDSYMMKKHKKSKYDDFGNDEFEDVRSQDRFDYNFDDEYDDDLNFDDLKEISMDEDFSSDDFETMFGKDKKEMGEQDDDLDSSYEDLTYLPDDEEPYFTKDDEEDDDDEYMRKSSDDFGDEKQHKYEDVPDDYFDNNYGEDDDLLEDSDMYEGDYMEGKGMCSECGSMLNEEGMCSECMKEGYHMNESKKKTIRLKESEFVDLIKKMVNESIPGLTTTEKSRKKSGSESKSYMKDVESKMKKTRKFDGNDNPEFPKQIGKGEKVARQNTSEEDEIMSNYRGGGLEDLKYDVKPSEKFEERLKKSLEGDSTMGNSHDAANVIKTKTGENMLKKAKKKKETTEKEFKVSWGHSWKEPENVNVVKESKNPTDKKLLDEVSRMKNIASYNKKTQ